MGYDVELAIYIIGEPLYRYNIYRNRLVFRSL